MDIGYNLATLNTLRAAKNMKPLKAWKESKAKLRERIDAMTGVTPLSAEGDDPLPGVDTNLPPRIDFVETESSHTLRLDELNIKPKRGHIHVDTTQLIDIPVPPKKPRTKEGQDTRKAIAKSMEKVDRNIAAIEAVHGPGSATSAKNNVAPADDDTYMGVKITKCPPSAELSAAEKRREQIAAIAEKRMKGDTEAKLPPPKRIPDPERVPKEKKEHAPHKRTKPEGTLSLADICRELSMDPKVGRAKMRRIPQADIDAVSTDIKYIFKLEHKAKVIEMLKKDLRK